ncbi:MAG: hypothetical protein Q8J78_00265 [Moraxellaceae bacterium]|nr:hypothetical protein [Moraxellaceae bacterium]
MVAVVVMAAAVGACTTAAPPSRGPVVAASPVPPAPPTAPTAPGAVVAPVPVAPVVTRPLPSQPARPVLADGSSVPAVQGLLTAAEQARMAGNLQAASSHLERAQRLAPQSPLVYQRLADLRLLQKLPVDAENFARKGLSFASAPAAQAMLWRLIAEARRQQGRAEAAQEALLRAQQAESPSTP